MKSYLEIELFSKCDYIYKNIIKLCLFITKQCFVVTSSDRLPMGQRMVIQLYMLTKVFSTKVVSLHRASNTEPKNHKNLWGKPLLKKFDDETQKK